MSGATAWPRVIVHADMDAFYAAVEQLDDPRLRGRPLLVGGDSRRSVVLTASYEARQFGVGSAMPMQRARQRCPQAVVVPPRFERYQEVSRIVMQTLGGFSPLVEPLSLDEAFLDMTGSERLFGAPPVIGGRIRAAVREATNGLTASVGVSGTRYVAKVASGYRKPDGLTVVPPHEARAWLARLPVSSLGAGPKAAARLEALGYATIGDVARADPRALALHFGVLGRRFAALAHGVDPRDVAASARTRSIGSERTLEVDVSARGEIEAVLRLSADAVARRLRHRARVARGVRIKLKRGDFRVITRQAALAEGTDVGAVLFARAAALLDEVRDAGPFRLVGLAAYDLESRPDGGVQLEIVPPAGSRARQLEAALDAVTERFGASAVQRAAELGRGGRVGVAANLDFLSDEDDRPHFSPRAR